MTRISNKAVEPICYTLRVPLMAHGLRSDEQMKRFVIIAILVAVISIPLAYYGAWILDNEQAHPDAYHLTFLQLISEYVALPGYIVISFIYPGDIGIPETNPNALDHRFLLTIFSFLSWLLLVSCTFLFAKRIYTHNRKSEPVDSPKGRAAPG
jgi:hypothetical protein